MPLIVEDGTGINGAHSFVTVAEADSFFSARGRPSWAGEGASEDEKASYLVAGADFLNTIPKFKGTRLHTEQTMALPTDVITVVPYQVKVAQFLLAEAAANGTDLISLFGQKRVTKEREKLEGLGETETVYADTAGNDAAATGSAIDGLLNDWTRSSKSGIQVAKRIYS